MAYIAPSATDADKKKNELLQKIIEKAIPLVDLYSASLISAALNRSEKEYQELTSKYETPVEGNCPPYTLSSRTLADFIQKIIWPQTYKFDSGWTDAPNQDKKSCAMRGIGLNQITVANLKSLLGNGASSNKSAWESLWGYFLNKTDIKDQAVQDAYKKSVDASKELDKLINELVGVANFDNNIEERQRVLYTLGGNDLISSIFYTNFLCTDASGKIIRLIANEPYLGYLYADIIWSSGMQAISGVGLKTPALGIVADDSGLAKEKRNIYAQWITKTNQSRPGTNLSRPDITNSNGKIDPGKLQTFAVSNNHKPINRTVKLDDKATYQANVAQAVLQDKLWLHVVPTLLKRHLQIVDLTSDTTAEQFKKYFEDAEGRLGFNPFDAKAFKDQATQRLGLNGSSLGEVSNLSMLAIIGELLCNNQASFQLNKLERNFLNVKYALYSGFTIDIP